MAQQQQQQQQQQPQNQSSWVPPEECDHPVLQHVNGDLYVCQQCGIGIEVIFGREVGPEYAIELFSALMSIHAPDLVELLDKAMKEQQLRQLQELQRQLQRQQPQPQPQPQQQQGREPVGLEALGQEETMANVTTPTLAPSGLDLSGLNQEQLQQLVSLVKRVESGAQQQQHQHQAPELGVIAGSVQGEDIMLPEEVLQLLGGAPVTTAAQQQQLQQQQPQQQQPPQQQPKRRSKKTKKAIEKAKAAKK